jgi:hypothetical protein
LAQENSTHAPSHVLFFERAMIETQLGHYQGSIDYSRQGQRLAWRAGRMTNVLACVVSEADAVSKLGLLSRARQLCEEARQIISRCGLAGSEYNTSLRDLEASLLSFCLLSPCLN